MAATTTTTEEEYDPLAARDLPTAQNTDELLAEHRRINGDYTVTRFPPEPNGYLHIGHAKSLHMNFHGAFEKLGVPEDKRRTIFRYDDTNPEAESQEYIDSIRQSIDVRGVELFGCCCCFCSVVFVVVVALVVLKHSDVN